MRTSHVILVLLGCVLGCAESEVPQPPVATIEDGPAVVPEEKKPSEQPPPADADAAHVTVRVIDETELEQAIERHRGKVVLVDFWATWCQSCKELFPHTVQLHRRLADRGLAVISVSLDDPEMEPQVLEFLRAQGATFENFISRYGASSESTQAFQIENDTLPNLKLYDRTGKRSRTFGGGEPFDAEDIDRAVEELLSQAPSGA